MDTASFPGVKSGRGVTLTPHPLLVPGKERVELYLYALHGPYGLYRASVPVQGCTLPYFSFYISENKVAIFFPFQVHGPPKIYPRIPGSVDPRLTTAGLIRKRQAESKGSVSTGPTDQHAAASSRTACAWT